MSTKDVISKLNLVGYKRVSKASFDGNEIRLFQNKSKPPEEQFILTLENGAEIKELNHSIESSDFVNKTISHLKNNQSLDVNENIDKIVDFLKVNKTEFISLSIVDILGRCLDPKSDEVSVSLSQIIKDLQKFLNKSSLDVDIDNESTLAGYASANIGIIDAGDEISQACYSICLEIDKTKGIIAFSIATD